MLSWQVDKSSPNYTRFFPPDISNFKSNVTKELHNALLQAWQPSQVSWWTFRILYIFFSVRGGGRGGGVRGARGGRVGFLFKIPGGGDGGVFREGEGPRGREGVCVGLGNLGGGRAAKYLFSGSKRPPRFLIYGTPPHRGFTVILYASWGPIFWAFFLRRSAQAPAIKAVRRTVAMKGNFDILN